MEPTESADRLDVGCYREVQDSSKGGTLATWSCHELRQGSLWVGRPESAEIRSSVGTVGCETVHRGSLPE